jgi:hypothetical protein
VVGQQGIDFRDARNQVVPPVAVPDKPFLNDLAPWETDYDEAKSDARAADEHNIRVLNNYGDATRSNVGGLPQFEQPPSVTPQLAIPSSSTAQMGGSPQPVAGIGGAAGSPPGNRRPARLGGTAGLGGAARVRRRTRRLGQWHGTSRWRLRGRERTHPSRPAQCHSRRWHRRRRWCRSRWTARHRLRGTRPGPARPRWR